jgi:OOP family OmpA-OmpF porin
MQKLRFLFCAIFLFTLFIPGILKAKQCLRVGKDGLIILIDASGSMRSLVNGTPKIDILKKSLNDFISHIPPSHLQVVMRSFGRGCSLFRLPTQVLYGPKVLEKEQLLKSVKEIHAGISSTPLGVALRYVAKDIENLKGKMALVIWSDGLETWPPKVEEVVKKIKEKHGDRLAISAVMIGKAKQGEKVLRQVTEDGGGFFAKADDLVTAEKMEAFVKKVLEIKELMCESKPRKKLVIKKRLVCIPGLKLVARFEFDSAKLNPNYYYQKLEKLGKCLEAHPGARVVIAGHTDNRGTKIYNLRLSLRRAEAIKAYLTQHFHISPYQTVIIGYGETKPIASNQTPEGRAKNRRVEVYLLMPPCVVDN